MALSRHGRPQEMFAGVNVYVVLILVRMLTVPCKCTFTKPFTLSSRLHHSHKKCAPMAAVYYGRFHNTLSADFQCRIRLLTEVLPRSKTINYDFILPSKTYQHHLATRAANVWVSRPKRSITLSIKPCLSSLIF